MKVILSEKDVITVGRIVAEKAMEMHKKGAQWHRNGKYLSCVDMGKIANKIVKATGHKWDFDSVFKKKLNSEQNPERSVATKMPNEQNDDK